MVDTSVWKNATYLKGLSLIRAPFSSQPLVPSNGPQNAPRTAEHGFHSRRRHANGPSAASLVASHEMTPLESAERYPVPSQKPMMSKQSTSPAAPASVLPLSSASIDPTPLFLNLLPITHPRKQETRIELPARQSTATTRKRCRSSRAILFCPFLSMAVTNLCSRRDHNLRPQSRCRRTARRRYLRDRTCPFRTLLLRSSNLFCPFLLMAVANLCSRRNRHLRSQFRCRSTRSARRLYLRDRSCRHRTWALLGRAVASHVQVVTRHGWRRSPSGGVGRSAVSVSSGHRQSTTMASFTLLLLLAFPLLLLLLPPSRQALGRASFLLAWTLRRWHSSHSFFLHVSML